MTEIDLSPSPVSGNSEPPPAPDPFTDEQPRFNPDESIDRPFQINLDESIDQQPQIDEDQSIDQEPPLPTEGFVDVFIEEEEVEVEGEVEVEVVEVQVSSESDINRRDFEVLDRQVRNGVQSFVQVGRALLQIRQRQLWQAAGYQSWDQYCSTVGGMTKTHANRLIRAAEVMDEFPRVTPNGSTQPALMPSSEWQVRPLCRLEYPADRVAAWSEAVARAEGGQPTARVVSEVVAERMGQHYPSMARHPDVFLTDAFARLTGEINSLIPSATARRRVTAILVQITNHLRLT